MTLPMFDNQIQSDQRRLECLRERVEASLAQGRDELQASLNYYQRAQANQAHALATVEARGQEMQRTRAVTPPMKSLAQIAPNKHLVLALGYVLAGMSGVLAVGSIGLMSAAKCRLDTDS